MKSQFKKQLFKILESAALKAVLKKLVISSGGLKAWIISFLVSELFDEILIPLMNLSIRKGELYYDMQKGKVQIRSVEIFVA